MAVGDDSSLLWPFTRQITFLFHPHLLNEVNTIDSFSVTFEAPCEESRFMGAIYDILVSQPRFSFVRLIASSCRNYRLL